MDKTEGILVYIESLINGSFEGWSEDEKNAYLTATTSIKKFVENMNNKCVIRNQ